jgi:hypothetical protein
MKNLSILFFAVMLFPIALTAQRQCVLFNREFKGTDTLYSITFQYEQMDAVREVVLQRLGAPSSDSYGNMLWKGVNLPTIGEQLEIHYKDMLCTTSGRNMNCKWFKSEEDKNRKVSKMNQRQKRMILLDFRDSDGAKALKTWALAREAAKLFGGYCS